MTTQILVTDATSFVSSHVIKQLQADGFQVRGAVASLEQSDEAVKKLLEEVNTEDVKYKVEIVQADPAKADAWENAMKDVQFVIHGIKPTVAIPSEQEGEAPAQPAVDSVNNVFKACVAAKSVRRVVLTSSYRAIIPPPATVEAGKQYSEADWADVENVDPLTKSIINAEKAAWDFVKELTDADKIELVVINPTQMVGPVILDIQDDIVKSLMDGSMKATANVQYELVDVRDVAVAHVKALTNADVAGSRVLVHGNCLLLNDMARRLSAEFKPQGYRIPVVSLPKSALWGLSLFNKHAKTLLPLVNKTRQYNNTKMTETLAIEPKDVKESIVEEAQVLVDRGVAKKTKKVKKDSSAGNGACPTPDNTAVAEEGGEIKEEGQGDQETKAEDKKEEKAEVEGEKKEAVESGDVKEEVKKEDEEKAPSPVVDASEAPSEKQSEETKEEVVAEAKAEDVKLEDKTAEESKTAEETVPAEEVKAEN